MPEHLSEKDARRYATRELDGSELLALDEHLRHCADCRRLLADSVDVSSGVAALRSDLSIAALEPYHLAYEELESHVNRTSDREQSEVIKSHLAECPSCAWEVSELESFRDGLTHRDRDGSSVRSGSVRRAFWLGQSLNARLVALAVVVAIAVGSSLLTRWVVKHNDNLARNGQIDALRRENDLLQREVEESRNHSQAGNTEASNSEGTSTSWAAVELRDGSGILYDAKGNLSAPASMPEQYKKLMEHALADGRVALPAWASGLRGKRGVLMGETEPGNSFNLESPVGTATLSSRPEFRWKKLDGATSYAVSVFDQDFNAVAKSRPLATNRWRPQRPLKRGTVYLWQVSATKDGQEITTPVPPEPEAKFKVIDSPAASEIERAREAYPDSHLLLGLLFARAGDVEQARREFGLLSEANPHSRLATRMVRSLGSK